MPPALHARPRVAMVTPRFAPHVGGVETHVFEVSRRLAERGMGVTVMTIDDTGELSPSETVGGVRVRRFRASAPGGFSAALRRELITSAGDFDVMHIQGIHTALPMM